MNKLALLGAAAMVGQSSQPAFATPADDAVHTVTHWLDRFNAGDMNAFVAGHAPDPVVVDEFAPYIWTGKDAPATWAKDFTSDAKAHAITNPHMDYGVPRRAISDGHSAYIVLPTVYHIRRGGTPMSAKGSMTFAMTHVDGSWKIASWTYSAPAPAPDR